MYIEDMEFAVRRSLLVWTCTAGLVFGIAYSSAQTAATPTAANSQITRTAGTIKSAQADSLVLTPDSGSEVTATLSASTKILRVPPGEKDLKNATPLQAQDLQPGDRVLVRGQASADGHSLAALAVIVMKQADVSAKNAHEQEDWQKRGVGGLVTATDTTAGTITISSVGAGGNHNVVIHASKTTIARRYSPDSVKFDDARPATLDQVKAGDQLRARGTRNPDGSELAAEEIVFGTFRNIAGTISSIDIPSNSLTVADAIGKNSVVVKMSPGSQIKKLPADIAQRIAQRLKGGGEANGQGAASGQMSGSPPNNGTAGTQQPRWPGGAGGQGGSAPPDLQRFLGRMPENKLADLAKGDAVMIVSTQGETPGTVTAITVLAGVEPILTASPNRTITLSPWSLSGGGGEGESAP
jgi:hypothetical protein